jgi:hypothetical protein
VSSETPEAEQEVERKLLLKEVERLERAIIDHYNELGREGERAVKSSDRRRRAFNHSCAEALKNACFRWGAEVRVTCRDKAEATFVWGVMEVEVSSEYQIELTNESCIRILAEDDDE